MFGRQVTGNSWAGEGERGKGLVELEGNDEGKEKEEEKKKEKKEKTKRRKIV